MHPGFNQDHLWNSSGSEFHAGLRQLIFNIFE
jgi:hypothetical protein